MNFEEKLNKQQLILQKNPSTLLQNEVIKINKNSNRKDRFSFYRTV